MSQHYKLHKSLIRLNERNRDGSHATQANRRAMLLMFAEQLKQQGFDVRSHMSAQDLKGRHINALVRQWKADGISAATMKNRMAVVRWWAEKIGNSGAVKSNLELGIENRQYVTNESKALTLDEIDLSKTDTEIALSIRLQSAFGLRREESMKFVAAYALNGQTPKDADRIRLKASWAKGGRARIIPVTNDQQRALLMEVLRTVGTGSLIPANKSYKTHLALFEKQTAALGIGRTHGLRHDYAQRRYAQPMGFDCRALDPDRELSEEEKAKDKEIRLQIAEELGHSRVNITSVYLGGFK